MKRNVDLTSKRKVSPALDKWSIVHVGSGFTMGIAGFPRPIAYGLIFLVEIVEFLLAPSTEFFQESRLNIFADVLIGTVAYEIGRVTAGLSRP